MQRVRNLPALPSLRGCVLSGSLTTECLELLRGRGNLIAGSEWGIRSGWTWNFQIEALRTNNKTVAAVSRVSIGEVTRY